MAVPTPPLGSAELACELAALSCPVPQNELHRLELLRDSGVLDSDLQEREWDRITAMVSKIFNVPICLVSLVDLNRQWFESIEIYSSYSIFVEHTILEDGPDVFCVLNSDEDVRFKDNALVTGPPFVKFYAGTALMLAGQKVGSLCIIDHVPRTSFSLEDKKTLFDFGILVSNMLKDRFEKVWLGRRFSSRSLLSLTHNMNTMASILSLSTKILIQDLQDAQLGDLSSLQNLDAATNRTCAAVTALLQLSKSLPSMNLNPEAALVVSSFGPLCDMVQIGREMKEVCALLYPLCDFQVDESVLSLGKHNVFADILVMVVFRVLNQAVKLSPQCAARIYFSPYKSEEVSSTATNIAGKLTFHLRATSETEVTLNLSQDLMKSVESLSVSSYDIGTGILNYSFNVDCLVERSNNSANDFAAEPPASNGVCVLIADDDEIYMEHLRKSLCQNGCEVVCSTDGLHAKKLYLASAETGSNFDLVLLDLLMPLMNGIDTMRNLHCSMNTQGTTFIASIDAADQYDQYFEDMEGNPASIGFNYVLVKSQDFAGILKVIEIIKTAKSSEGIMDTTMMKPRKGFFSFLWSSFEKSSKIHPSSETS